MRDTTQLHPALQDKIAQLIIKCNAQGLKIGIGECLRTVAEQNALYAQGRTKPGKIVTKAKGDTYSSMHQWGVAFDFYRNDGLGAFNDNDGFFTNVGRIGKSLGLEWGGDWKSIKDKPHFQLKDWGSTTAKLKQLYGTPDKFMKTWNTKQVKTTSDKQTKTETKTIKYKVTSESGLWIRKEPSTSAKKIIAMPYGSEFVSSKSKDGWVYGTWNGNTGWSSAQYLKRK